MKPAIETLAKDVARPDGKKAFTLPGRNRTEWLTPVQARVRNRNREGGNQPGRWTEAPGVPAHTVTEPNPVLADKEWRQTFHEGIRKDHERFAAQQRVETPKDTTMSATATAEKKSTKTKKTAKPENGEGSKRPKFHDIGVIAWILHMGKKGTFGPERALKIITKMGLTSTINTVKSYLPDGKTGKHEAPNLNVEQKKAFNTLAEAVPEIEGDVPPLTRDERAALRAKEEKKNGGKKEKTAKSNGKASGKNGNGKKKAKKSEDESEPSEEEREAALAEAQDGKDEDDED